MLREETVEPSTLGLLRSIVALPELKHFRLVGRTAFSLLYGHRKSIDLDFFTDQPLDMNALLPVLEENFGKITPVNIKYKSIYQCVIREVKVDFVSVKDPFLYPSEIKETIPFADIRELIALKLNAVKGRGSKKDFWDVAKLLQTYSLDNLFQFYHDRYDYDDTFAVIRSMGFFGDAEDDPDPETLDGMTWDKVKEIITQAFDVYFKKYKN